MHFLITAGPTREPLDPVRYLTNRSSGKMGYAMAKAAVAAGHSVTLVSGPVHLLEPEGLEMIKVETAKEMLQAVQGRILAADVAIFSAAVADYRPVQQSGQKIKKSADRLILELERTDDILGSARSVFGFTGYLVGFAAETENVVEYAQAKLARKGCDLVIANDVSQTGIGFDSADNAVTLCYPGGKIRTLPQQTKIELAHKLICLIAESSISKGVELASR